MSENNNLDSAASAPRQPRPPRVFISYSHDSAEHNARVLRLAARLRGDGVESWLDQFEVAPPEGWPRWCTRQILEASFVVLVCTADYNRRFLGLEKFGQGRGVKWEGKVIQNILYYSEVSAGFIPIIFSKSDESNIPPTVKEASWFLLDDSFSGTSYAELISQLTAGNAFPPLAVPTPSLNYLQRADASVPHEEGWLQSERIQRSIEDLKTSQKRQHSRNRFALACVVILLTIGGGFIAWRLYGIKAAVDDGRALTNETRRLVIDRGMTDEQAREIIATKYGLSRDQVDAKLKEFNSAAKHGNTKDRLDSARAAFADKRYADSAKLAEFVGRDFADTRQQSKTVQPDEAEVEREAWKLAADSYRAERRYLDEIDARRRLIDLYGGEQNPAADDKLWPWLEANSELAYVTALAGELGGGRAKIDFVLARAEPALETFRHANAAAPSPTSDSDPRVLYISFRNIRSLIARWQGDPQTQLKDCVFVWDASKELYGSIRDRTLSAGTNLALAYSEQRRFDEALTVEQQVIDMLTQTRGLNDPETLQARLNHAATLQESGKVAEALVEQQALVKPLTNVSGPDHAATLNVRHNIANTLLILGQASEAEKMHREVLAARIRIFGPNAADTLLSRLGLANALHALGRFPEAEKEARIVVTNFEAQPGPEHQWSIKARVALVSALMAQQLWDDAEPIQRRSVQVLEKVSGSDKADTLAARNNLALILTGLGRFSEAEDEHRTVLDKRVKTLGPKHPDTLSSEFNVGNILVRQLRFPEAASVLDEVRKLRGEVLGFEHPKTVATQLLLASVLCESGEFDRAELLFKEVISHVPALAEQQRIAAKQGLEGCLSKRREPIGR